MHLHSDREIPGSTLKASEHGHEQPRRILHCPLCEEIMELQELGPVEIDVCPKCGGVFLDRGELQTLTGYDLKTGQHVEDDSHYILYTPKGLRDF
ncbi:MAG: zf-TFIIB domain-containing protein [Leptospiraceae bacterium]|nr:zf-TFIIB domain-containing protein [Leptospiraceae bacterium]